MSVADHEIDEPGQECRSCGLPSDWPLCRECQADAIDQMADWKIRDAKEGK